MACLSIFLTTGIYIYIYIYRNRGKNRHTVHGEMSCEDSRCSSPAVAVAESLLSARWQPLCTWLHLPNARVAAKKLLIYGGMWTTMQHYGPICLAAPHIITHAHTHTHTNKSLT
jgi:hypothetical protein